MRKNLMNIQILAKEELKVQFDDLFEQSGANSKAEFLNTLLQHFTETEEIQNNSKALEQKKSELIAADDLITELENEILQLKRQIKEVTKDQADIETNRQDEPQEQTEHDIVLNLTQEQREILEKCYASQENIGEKILTDLVKMASQWVMTKKGSLFSNDEYIRLFELHGIPVEQFDEAFAQPAID